MRIRMSVCHFVPRVCGTWYYGMIWFTLMIQIFRIESNYPNYCFASKLLARFFFNIKNENGNEF